MLPYAFDTNDMQFFHANRFCGAGDFASYVIDALGWLHREGAHAPKIMSIGFHLRMIGQPGRIAALHKILGHIADRGNVRNCATDRHHQPLARTVPRELMFKAYARLMATVWRAAPEGVDHRIAGAARLRRFRAIAAILLRA